MRKYLHFITAVLMTALASSCSDNGNSLEQMLDNVDYYPVRVEGQKQWSLMATDGTIIFNDSFPTAPSAAVEGVFSVRLDKGITVFIVGADGSASVIAEGLRSSGAMNGDRMPVCRPDSSIEVIDRLGKKVFSLGDTDGHNFNACAAYYSCGLLTVRDCATNLWGAVDREGRIAVEPEYDFVSVFEDGHALAVREGKLAVLDRKGNCKMLDGDFEMVTGNFVHGHSLVIDRKNGRRCIVDTKGDVSMPDQSVVALLLCREGAIFMNHLGEYGVIGYNGDVTIVPAARDLLMGISGTDMLLQCVGGRYSVIESGGKVRGEFPASAEKVVPLFGARGFMVMHKTPTRYCQLFGTDLKPRSDIRLSNFERRLSLNDIILSDRDEDHRIFNSADPDSDTPDWMEPDEEEGTDSVAEPATDAK